VRRSLAPVLTSIGSGGKSIGVATYAQPYAMYEMSLFPGEPFNVYLERMQELARSPALRSLPCNLPNPDFEEGTQGWGRRGTLQLEQSTEVSHTGKASAKASGSIEGQNEYLVTRYGSGPPWEISWLKPGETCRVQAWLRVDKLGEGIPAPSMRISVREKGSTLEAFYTDPYDMQRAGQWQLLRTEFTVPDSADSAYIAVNTHTHDPQEVLMYLDDVAVVPVATPARDTYVYPAVEAQEAELTGSLSVGHEEVRGEWKFIHSPRGESGAATFELEAPLADVYRLLARVHSPDKDAALEVSLDGNQIGSLLVEQSDQWSWKDLALRAGVGLLQLETGRHTVVISWPEEQEVRLQKVCLTNELLP